MVNFNIVEGKDILDEIQDEFIKLYQDGVKVEDICKKLNITLTQFQSTRRRLFKMGLLDRKRNNVGGRKKQSQYSKLNPKNYTYSKPEQRYVVRYKKTYYGSFRKEKEAQKFVELMRECNWDKNKAKENKKKVIR